jgi:hypothetical protein
MLKLLEKDAPLVHKAAVFVPSTNELFVTISMFQDKKRTPYVPINKIIIWCSGTKTANKAISWTIE